MVLAEVAIAEKTGLEANASTRQQPLAMIRFCSIIRSCGAITSRIGAPFVQRRMTAASIFPHILSNILHFVKAACRYYAFRLPGDLAVMEITCM
jgi:hypothetical protein